MAEGAAERQGALLSYPGLDVVKFLMALLVVEIHTNPFFVGGPGLATDTVRGVDCLAVPFFFIASGFLCFRRVRLNEFSSPDSPSSVRVRKTLFRQLRMYLAWTVLYLPITVWADVAAGNSSLKSTLLFVRGTLLIGENQYSWPLWCQAPKRRRSMHYRSNRVEKGLSGVKTAPEREPHTRLFWQRGFSHDRFLW
jgi:peptidoglycan/LPS O-acetylase OafA/YrhL